jgi:signal transduction histidine kinase
VATALPSFAHAGGVVPFGLLLSIAGTAGMAVRQHRLYGEELVRDEARQAADRAEQERARIARELHDVVAHGMSVITVQASYGRLVLHSDPAGAGDALAAIETTGRQSLVDLRRLLGFLRPESHPVEGGPAPRLADLPGLAERTALAGVRVHMSVTGEPEPVDPVLELSAYRIVQEALTNVVKHAGTDSARVAVRHRPDAVVVDVVDGGRGGDLGPEGRGISGMRERAALCGGTLSAGPVPDGGFRVTATLPRFADRPS